MLKLVVSVAATLAVLVPPTPSVAKERFYTARRPLVVIVRPRSTWMDGYDLGTTLPSSPPGNPHPWAAKKFFDYSDRYNTGGSSN